MLIFDFLDKGLGIVSPVYFEYDFSIKMFFVYFINWPNFIAWLPLLLEILGYMCIAIVCYPGCDIIDFEINLIFLIEPFKWLSCRRAEKNSVVSQTFKMELLEKIVKMFKEIPRKLTRGISFCKVAANKALILVQQDSARETIWRRTLLRKLFFKVTEKEKPSWMLSESCSLLKMDNSSDHFLQTFIKY